MFKTILSGVLALTVAAAFAQHQSNRTNAPKFPAKSKPAAKTQAPKPFVCVHCGRKIALTSSAELNKTCKVCACGTTNLACKPAPTGR